MVMLFLELFNNPLFQWFSDSFSDSAC